jgi:lipopolysaccharide heptosyltransferase II
MINKILFITLSNIGDVILTLPVLDSLRLNFPGAKITVMSGERPKEIFEDNPFISKAFTYNKRAPIKEKKALFNELKIERFDLIVDLRNTFYGAFLPAEYRTSPYLRIPKSVMHMRDKHLCKILNSKLKISKQPQTLNSKSQDQSLFISRQDEGYIEKILQENNIKGTDAIIIVAPGARAHPKRWAKEKFAFLCKELITQGYRMILVGDDADTQVAEYIKDKCDGKALNLCGKTCLTELGALIKKTRLVVTNDSAVLHLASYLNAPTVAIFGPTNDESYGPWSDRCAVVKKEIFCRPCEKAQCRFGTLDCLRMVKVEDVAKQVNNLLNSKLETLNPKPQIPNYKRILIVRTDRIGDVLLSTPVIRVLREAYPQAYIAMMVSPYAKEIVEGNPYVDDVIIYDKEAKHKSWGRSIRFARNLKKKRFDLSLILHPTNRVHLVTYFAGIPRRIGYDRKLGFLLTDKVKHTKHLGEKHESEYNLDLVRLLGIEPLDNALYMPLKQYSERWAEDLFLGQGIKETDKLLAIHPGASCPSKIWPNERFALVADRLIEKYGFKILVVSGPKDISLAQSLIKNMRHPAINIAGKTSLSQLASILKRCRLFISNDSGPVHVACAVGTPVISIFGRSQKGLSPKRWGPVGGKDKILHKDVGCVECLAHDCAKEFACLKEITADDVIRAIEAMQKEGVDL